DGEDGAVAVDDVVAEQQRDLRVRQRGALQRVGLRRAAGVEHRSHAPLLERCLKLRPVLHELRQLPELLLERELQRNCQQPTANINVSLQYPPMRRAALLLLILCGCSAAYAGRQRAVSPAPSQEWARGAVFYEIFVRSFADSDGDGVGDFNGLTAKLDYLTT